MVALNRAVVYSRHGDGLRHQVVAGGKYKRCRREAELRTRDITRHNGDRGGGLLAELHRICVSGAALNRIRAAPRLSDQHCRIIVLNFRGEGWHRHSGIIAGEACHGCGDRHSVPPLPIAVIKRRDSDGLGGGPVCGCERKVGSRCGGGCDACGKYQLMRVIGRHTRANRNRNIGGRLLGQDHRVGVACTSLDYQREAAALGNNHGAGRCRQGLGCQPIVELIVRAKTWAGTLGCHTLHACLCQLRRSGQVCSLQLHKPANRLCRESRKTARLEHRQHACKQ